MRRILVNIVAFQATWLSCAFSAATGDATAGIAMGLFAVALHLGMSSDRTIEAIFILLAGALGFFLESSFSASGLLTYSAAWPWPGLASAWIVVLWMAFATLFSVSLVWLKKQLPLAALLGGLGGLISYVAADKIGALQLSQPVWQSLCVIVLGWAAVTPSLLMLHNVLKARSTSKNL